MTSISSAPSPTDTAHDMFCWSDPRENEPIRKAEHTFAKGIVSRAYDAFSTRFRGDLCCALAAAHLTRGYLNAPKHPDITALIGNAFWETLVPSRSALFFNSAQWVMQQCPIFPQPLAQATSLFAQYAPTVELLLSDPFVEVAIIGALIVTPTLCERSKIPSRYHTAIVLGVVSTLHATLSGRTARTILIVQQGKP